MADDEYLSHAEGVTLPSLLKYWSNIVPDTPAYIFVGKQTRTVLSRRDVFSLAGKMSARLHRLGVSKGDVVANMLPNGPERLIYDFGILMAGGISQTALGYLNNADDTLGALKIAQTTTIITVAGDKAVSGVLAKLFSSSKITNYGLEVHCSKLPRLKKVIYGHSKNGKDIKEQLLEEKEIFIEDVCPNDYAVIVETSGTTGICKQIPHTHSSIVRFGEQMCFLIGDNGSPFYNDRFFGWFPGYPCVYACSGTTRVVLDAREEHLPAILDVMRNEGCRSAFLVPSEIEQVMQSKDNSPAELKPLEVVLTGGQPISKKSTRILGSLTKRIVCRYGMSEAMCICHLSVSSQGEFQDHSVGYPMPSYHVRVVDDAGEDVGVGQQGTIFIKGDGVFNGYLPNNTYWRFNSGDTDEREPKSQFNSDNQGLQNDPLKSQNGTNSTRAKVISKDYLIRDAFTTDGWFRTDDIGFFDTTGKLFVHGRGSDAIMHGDEILYPYWLERLVRECPAVDDIAIVPVADPVLCHEICACIKPVPGCNEPVAEVRTFMTQQFADLPHEECSITPRFYLLFEAFPLNKNMKVNRKELSRVAEDRLKL